MQENTLNSFSAQIPIGDGQINPPNYKPSKKPLIFIFSILFISIVILIALIFTSVFSKNKPKEEKKLIPTVVPTEIQAAKIPTLSLTQVEQNINPVIVYLREGNIWMIKSDGTSLRQLTHDGDNNIIKYSSLTFFTKEEIGFIRCETNISRCSIISKNLTTNGDEILVEQEATIIAFAIDNNKKLIAYIKSNDKGSTALHFFENKEEKKILDFQSSLGRGSGLSDEISLSFSPDSRYLLVVNTGTQPNTADDKKTIWVIDQTGNIVDSIQKEFATDAVWEEKNRFFYKDKDILFRKIVGGLEENIGNLSGYDISISLDKKSILVWNVADNGQTSISNYLIDNKSAQELKKDLGYAKWLDHKNIVAVKTTKSDQSYFGFETKGLVKYDLKEKQEKILDSNSSIYQFVIQPQSQPE